MSVKIGLVGTGTVGGGCLDILQNHQSDFKRHFGIDLELVRVCSRRSDAAKAHGLEDIFTTDFNEVITDPEVDLVIEPWRLPTPFKKTSFGAPASMCSRANRSISTIRF